MWGGHKKRIDGYIPMIPTLIEQKSANKSLEIKYEQSDGAMLTPFEQAKRYDDNLIRQKKAKYIIVCNFKEIHLHDMDSENYKEPLVIKLEELPEKFELLDRVLTYTEITLEERIIQETELSVEAGKIVGRLYDSLKEQYRQVDDNVLHQLNQLCVRIIFCLYAEDMGLFPESNYFYKYMSRFNAEAFGNELEKLFEVLNTREDDLSGIRNYASEELNSFPYVNGGIFAEQVPVPNFTPELRDLVLKEASAKFNWANISPTIFGSVFESTLNPETRHKGGMHYTSIENIHKVIDPLFLNELNAEFEEIGTLKTAHGKEQRAKKLLHKISNLNFLDPACGSGNFLTETYLCLKSLEIKLLKVIHSVGNSIKMDVFDERKNKLKDTVTLDQFHGIEINDFAVSVAKTALWISESQMLSQMEDLEYTGQTLEDFFPLTNIVHITEGNALTTNWNDIIDKRDLDYIIGNPPFLGGRLMTKSQKDDLKSVMLTHNGKPFKGLGNLDFVTGWFYKASQMMVGTKVKTALVATNSISQGQLPALLWKPIMDQFNIKFDFAYESFVWDSKSLDKAQVHVVIIGFSNKDTEIKNKYLFKQKGEVNSAKNINPYLINADNIFIEARKLPVSSVPSMMFGDKPIDDGLLSNIDYETKNKLITDYPNSKKYFRKIVGAKEFIRNEIRYCLWLDSEDRSWQNIPDIVDVVNKVEEFRKNSKREATKKLASTPFMFGEIRELGSNYLIVPRVSSENRSYIPMGFENQDTIPTDSVYVIPNASLYHFGVLESSVHMTWMRTFAGRLEMRYRYSNLVYNSFPWPTPTAEEKEKIEETAQKILDIRAKYPEQSLAELYDPETMPNDLKEAHKENDSAVRKAYRFKEEIAEEEIIPKLMKLYEKITKGHK